MSEQHEQETEHEGDEAAETPVSPETEIDKDEEAHEEEEAETPPSEPTEALAPKSEKEIEKALKTVERAGTSYRNAVSRAMGEDANALLPCPRCNAPVAGMIFPPSMAPVDDETREAVLVSIGVGGGEGSYLNEAKGVKECETCDGWGQLAYPTKVEHTATQSCPKCQGSGYVTDEAQQEQNVYTIPAQQITTGSIVAQVGPCPRCGMAGMDGQPHFCNPAQSVGASGV